MSSDINFLAKQKVNLERRDRTDRTSFIFVVALLAIAGLIFLGLWYVNNNYRTQIAGVDNEKRTLEQRLTQNQNQELDYLVFYEKVRKLTELIGNRSHGTEALVDSYRYFTTLNTAVSQSVYDYYTQNLELTLACDDVFSLPRLFQLVQDPEFTSQYQTVELLSLTRDDNGQYKLQVNLEL